MWVLHCFPMYKQRGQNDKKIIKIYSANQKLWHLVSSVCRATEVQCCIKYKYKYIYTNYTNSDHSPSDRKWWKHVVNIKYFPHCSTFIYFLFFSVWLKKKKHLLHTVLITDSLIQFELFGKNQKINAAWITS